MGTSAFRGLWERDGIVGTGSPAQVPACLSECLGRVWDYVTWGLLPPRREPSGTLSLYTSLQARLMGGDAVLLPDREAWTPMSPPCPL